MARTRVLLSVDADVWAAFLATEKAGRVADRPAFFSGLLRETLNRLAPADKQT